MKLLPAAPFAAAGAAQMAASGNAPLNRLAGGLLARTDFSGPFSGGPPREITDSMRAAMDALYRNYNRERDQRIRKKTRLRPHEIPPSIAVLKSVSPQHKERMAHDLHDRVDDEERLADSLLEAAKRSILG